jgi:hypothetical protein
MPISPEDRTDRHTAVIVWLVFLACLAITAYGLTHSAVAQGLRWPRSLTAETALLAGVAMIGTATCMSARSPVLLRGWRGLLGIAGTGIAISFGAEPTLAAVVVVAACFIAGHALLAATGSEIDDAATVLAVGIAATILLFVGAGITHLPMLPVFWLFIGAMLAFPLVASGVRDRLAMQATRWSAPVAPLRGRAIEVACATVMLFEVLFLTAYAAMPERYYDALTMHFLVPTQVLTFGRWTYDPHLSFAFYPIGADYLFSFAMAMGGELAAKLINLCAVLLTGALLYGVVRHRHGERLACVAVILFLGIPVTLIVTASLFVDNTVCLLTTLAFRLLVLQRERPGRSPLIGLAVVLPALAAVKLHGVLIALSGTAIALYSQDYRVLRRRDWNIIGCVAVAAGTLGSLTYVYAWIKTGNPVFPLMNDIFRSPLWPPVAFEDARFVGHLAPDILYRMTFETDRYMEALPGALGFAFMALLGAGIVATLLSRDRVVVIALIVAGFYTAVVLAEEQILRYLYPIFPLLLVCCIHGLAAMARLRWSRPALVAAVSGLALLDIAWLPSAGWILPATDLRALFDPARRHQMLLGQVPERLANEAINALGVGRPRVIYASDPYGAFLRGTPIYTNWYNLSFATQLGGAQNPDQVRDAIDAQHAAFAVVNTRSQAPVDRAVGSYAEQHGTRVADIGALRVYRLGETKQP